MNFDNLKDKLKYVYDFDKPDDCQKVMEMLLRDLSGANKRAEQAATQLKLLASMVVRNRPDVREKAESILKGSSKCSEEDVMDALSRLSRETESAGKLSDQKLTDEVFQYVWGELDITGRPSALVEEIIHRFKELAGIKEEPDAEDKVS